MTYTADQYARAKAQIGKASPEVKAILRQRIHEYEVTTPQRDALREGVDETMPASTEAKASIPELPADSSTALGIPADFIDTTRDENLPNASKLKTLATPPEYVSKNPLAGIAHVAKATLMDPLDGPGAGMYMEPSEKQFETDMGPVLKARGIVQSSDPLSAYQDAYAEYKDRQWKKAYDQAAATDTPLTRVAHAGDSQSGWTKLERLLAQTPDVLSTFAKGYASGATAGAIKVLGGASDSMTGGDESLRDREQAERNPIAAGAGELVGAINPKSIMSKVAGAVSRGATGIAERFLPGAASRIAGAATGALAAGETDLAGRAAGQAAVDQAHGWGTDDAKSTFTKNLLGTGLISAGLGGLGQGLVEGAGVFQKGTSKAYPELGPLREGGGDTDFVRGVRPPAEVSANEEAARFPIPGEAKARPTGTAEEIAASKLQEPLTAQNASDMKRAVKQAEEENARMFAANPELRKAKPVTATANALLDEVLGRVDPGKAGQSEFIPAEGSDLAYSNNRAHIEAVKKLWKPQVVLATEAPALARSANGRVITVEEAQRLKYPLSFSDSEGVPIDAPPLDESSSVGAVRARGVQNAVYARDGMRDLTDARSYYQGKSPEEAEKIATTLSKPIDVAVEPGDSGKTVVLQDGRHRMAAAREAGAKNILARVRTYDADGNTVKLETAVVPIESMVDTPAGATTEEVFGRPADPIKPYAGQYLGPRAGRAKPPPAPEPGSDWDGRDRRMARFEHVRGERPPLPGETYIPKRSDDPTRVSNSPPIPMPAPTPSAPSGPPPELVASSPTAATAKSAGMPSTEFRVVMTPTEMDAQTLENQLKVIDRAAKAGTEAQVDPIYNRLQKEIRTDREQFGKDWAELKEKHHDVFTQLEQRAGAVNLAGDDPYSKMTAQQRKAFNETLLAYGNGRPDATEALRSLARDAGKGPELDTLGAQNAYTKLKGRAQPRLGEAIGPSLDVTAHLRGLGPAARLRGDALARAVSRGVDDTDGYLPGMSILGMGNGGMGLKTGSVYDSTRDRGRLKPRLSESERQELQNLLDATQAQGAK